MRSLALVAALALLAPAGTSAASAPGRLEFQLIRNGHPDGRHIVTVTQTGEGVSVRSELQVAVRIGPVTAYSLRQTCREDWNARANALNALTCSTLKNGRRMQVSVQRTNGGLQVTGVDGAATMPLATLPATWWQRPRASGSMIDTQNGRPIRVRVENLGRETIDVAGRRVIADHMRVSGTVTADLWYDQQGRWVGCAFDYRGQHVRYRLVSPLDAAPAAA